MRIFKSLSNDTVVELIKENKRKERRILQLENLCREKDYYFTEVISDGMRHGSSLAARHMSERKRYLKGK